MFMTELSAILLSKLVTWSSERLLMIHLSDRQGLTLRRYVWPFPSLNRQKLASCRLTNTWANITGEREVHLTEEIPLRAIARPLSWEPWSITAVRRSSRMLITTFSCSKTWIFWTLLRTSSCSETRIFWTFLTRVWLVRRLWMISW